MSDHWQHIPGCSKHEYQAARPRPMSRTVSHGQDNFFRLPCMTLSSYFCILELSFELSREDHSELGAWLWILLSSCGAHDAAKSLWPDCGAMPASVGTAKLTDPLNPPAQL